MKVKQAVMYVKSAILEGSWSYGKTTLFSLLTNAFEFIHNWTLKL